ncbi:RrF2 family transcriptional regulator [Cerasicoccus fimbriatus]|uniref:RrF2 family transcriptional regulator n=1 Tax=Cerasicoccus fimbriatus TaxID=3014554 RepID=UPI0022B45501|nr:Rrf2 family transcriptional regulator [Cerasicoccus sp. TK19100]
MELTAFTDYSLRVLMYLAREEGIQSSIDELANYYGVSRHHIAKITGHLAKAGYLKNSRGKNGGVSLAKRPEEINLAEVIRCTEPHFNLVECFSGEPNGCLLNNCCRLKGILFGARAQFFQHLEQYTIADAVVGNWPDKQLQGQPA